MAGPSHPGDIVARLSEAASAAIANERASLTHPVGAVRGVTIEVLLSPKGAVTEAVAFVERRTDGPSILARYANR